MENATVTKNVLFKFEALYVMWVYIGIRMS